MKVGQVVTIFDDPITRQRPEGKARLQKKTSIKGIEGLQYWFVKFMDDEMETTRWIKA